MRIRNVIQSRLSLQGFRSDLSLKSLNNALARSLRWSSLCSRGGHTRTRSALYKEGYWGVEFRARHVTCRPAATRQGRAPHLRGHSPDAAWTRSDRLNNLSCLVLTTGERAYALRHRHRHQHSHLHSDPALYCWLLLLLPVTSLSPSFLGTTSLNRDVFMRPVNTISFHQSFFCYYYNVIVETNSAHWSYGLVSIIV